MWEMQMEAASIKGAVRSEHCQEWKLNGASGKPPEKGFMHDWERWK